MEWELPSPQLCSYIQTSKKLCTPRCCQFRKKISKSRFSIPYRFRLRFQNDWPERLSFPPDSFQIRKKYLRSIHTIQSTSQCTSSYFFGKDNKDHQLWLFKARTTIIGEQLFHHHTYCNSSCLPLLLITHHLWQVCYHRHHGNQLLIAAAAAAAAATITTTTTTVAPAITLLPT
jgi:hypothetical protein